MSGKPIEKKERVYQHIVQEIIKTIERKELLPGDKLPSERKMSETFGVSRTSVKEAVVALKSAGIITVKPGIGMFLNEENEQSLLFKLSNIFNEDNLILKDLIEVRQGLEGDAAYYAAQRITDEQKQQLTKVYERLVLTEKQGNPGIEEDFQFHYIIVEAANNPLMLEVINLVSDRIREAVRETREKSYENEVLNKQVAKEHEDIFNAIINEQPEEARKAMWEHHKGIKKRHLGENS